VKQCSVDLQTGKDWFLKERIPVKQCSVDLQTGKDWFLNEWMLQIQNLIEPGQVVDQT